MSRPTGNRILIAYVACLTLAFAAILLLTVDAGALTTNAWLWAAFCLLFASSERAAVLFHDRRLRFGLSASEAVLMPMIVALTLPQVTLGAALGIAIARSSSRGLSLAKELFNVCGFGCSAAAASATFLALSHPGPGMSANEAGAAVAAVVMFSVVNHLFYALVSAFSGRSNIVTALADVGVPELLSLGGNLAVGLLFAAALQAGSWTVALFPVALAGLYLGYRAVVHQWGARERLKQLHAAGHALGSTPDLGDALAAFLDSVAQALSAVGARAIVETKDGLRWSGNLARMPVARMEPLNDEMRDLLERVMAERTPLVTFEDEILDALETQSIAAVPLFHDEEIVGVLAATDRIGTEFSAADLTLLDALGKELCLALESRRLFAEVEEGRERFELLVGAVRDYAICMLDPTGAIESWNAGAERIFGFRADEIIGGHVSRFYPDRESDERWSRELRAAEIDGAWEGQHARVRKDGSLFTAEIVLTPVHTSDGTPRGFAMVTRDISERVRAEEEKESLQTQLHQAQKLDTVGRLAGGIAHDFNNLIGVLLNYSNFVMTEITDENVLEDVRQIKTAAEKARALTRQLLIFSRRETPTMQRVDLNEIVADFQKLLRRTLGEDILLTTDLDPAVPAIEADAGQLEQVIMNLAVNARDAMTAGGTLTISTEVVVIGRSQAQRMTGVRPGRHARLTVTDTGGGMSRDVRERALEPFFTTKPKEMGTGLGLSTVYGIVQQSGGRIDIRSQPGLGTSVTVDFPEALGAQVAPVAVDTAPADGRGETVLLVEDQDVVRAMTSRILTNSGYRVVEARSGPEALIRLKQTDARVELLLSDVVMPQMSGLELGRKLAELDPRVKVLYMSGFSNGVLSAQRNGDDELTVLMKPFEPAELLSKVREVLDT